MTPHFPFPAIRFEDCNEDGDDIREAAAQPIQKSSVHAQAISRDLPIHHGECPHAPGAQRQQSRAVIAQLEALPPGARHGLLHSLDNIREIHRDAYPDSKQEVVECSECGEITSRLVCQSCTMKKWLSEAS